MRIIEPSSCLPDPELQFLFVEGMSNPQSAETRPVGEGVRVHYAVERSHVATPSVSTAFYSALPHAGFLCTPLPREQRRKQMPLARTARPGMMSSVTHHHHMQLTTAAARGVFTIGSQS